MYYFCPQAKQCMMTSAISKDAHCDMQAAESGSEAEGLANVPTIMALNWCTAAKVLSIDNASV